MYCPSCGEKMPDEARFCYLCGANLAELKEAPEPPGEPVKVTKGDVGLDRSQTVVVHVGKDKEGESLAGHHCPICGVFLRPQDAFFRCRECRRDHLCLRHRHEQLYVCEECAAEVRGVQPASTGEVAERRTQGATDDIDPYGEMILIPAGEFIMGEGNEARTVYVDDFYIAKYPVTNARYAAYMAAEGYSNKVYWSSEGWEWLQRPDYAEPRYWKLEHFNRADQPVVGVSYYEAEAYCRWAGLRLPAEQEWEKTARGIDGRIYPWSNQWQEGRCNSKEAGLGHTTPVHQHRGGASPYGAMDMAGNVWEWISASYEAERAYRVLHGGSWNIGRTGVRCVSRIKHNANDRRIVVGFRCARSSP